MKNSFVMYTDYLNKFQSLSDEQLGKLFRSILIYESDRDNPEREIPYSDDFSVNLAFDVVREDLDRNGKKYEEIVEKRKMAGKKGGIAKASKSKQKVANLANASFAKQTLANLADNDNDNVNVNVNVNVNDKDIKEKPKRKKKQTVEESRVGKIQFADEVYLTKDEYLKLTTQYGKDGVRRMIDILDSYKGSNGKTYLSDYKAILNWVVKRYEEENQKTVKPKTNNPWSNNTESVDQEMEYRKMLGIN